MSARLLRTLAILKLKEILMESGINAKTVEKSGVSVFMIHALRVCVVFNYLLAFSRLY